MVKLWCGDRQRVLERECDIVCQKGGEREGRKEQESAKSGKPKATVTTGYSAKRFLCQGRMQDT